MAWKGRHDGGAEFDPGHGLADQCQGGQGIEAPGRVLGKPVAGKTIVRGAAGVLGDGLHRRLLHQAGAVDSDTHVDLLSVSGRGTRPSGSRT